MTSAPPPPDDEDRPGEDPFRKRQPPAGQGGGSPYDPPGGGRPPGEQDRRDSPYGPPADAPPPHDGPNPPPYGGANPPPPDGGTPYGNEQGAPYGGQGQAPHGADANNPYDGQGSGPYGDRPPPGDGGLPPYGGEGGTPYDRYPGGPGHAGPGPGDPLAGMAPLAPSGKRVLARLVDMVLVGIVVYLLTLLFHVSQTDFDHVEAGRTSGQYLVTAILYVGYDVLMSQRGGQTLGKRLFRLRVARLDNGLTPGTSALLLRAVVLWLPFVFCCCVWTAICGGYSFIDRPYKQGLHDKAAKTVVVEV